ncbi:hypothetical protein [Salinibacillus xinjiangensis]|uniref:Uncharacterized protein n=1 Tax=Salinibacillus xinjiangensis TaxID=1229268 RepID=A0A6G1XBI4_9BACI|nr:hypothetical protein [Salinibacillus xinjiangensis]MRG88148.1 hypothetical protein [Salinibacillus xinjiangensis]
MKLKLDSFVLQKEIKNRALDLINSESDTVAINLLKEITSVGELRKIRIFTECQKKNIANNFTILAIFISSTALVLPSIERIFPFGYIVISMALSIGLIFTVFKEILPFINKTDEYNTKIDYLLWLIDEEIERRYTYLK